MKIKVYTARDEGPVFTKMIKDAGYELVIGKGIEPDKYADADVILPFMYPFGEAQIEPAKKCRLIDKVGVGVDNIDIPACTERGIIVCNTPGSNTTIVAEHTIAMVMAAAHHLWERYRLMESPDGGWKKAGQMLNLQLCGKTIGIAGFGNIGRRVAELAHGIGMKVIVYSEHAVRGEVPDYVELASSLDEVLERADVFSPHIGARPDQKDYIGRAEFAKMKKGVIFINTCRGFIVNQDALVEALKDGTISAAAIDVTEKEPLPEDNPLVGIPNLLITPHCAAFSAETRVRTQEMLAENVISFINTGNVPEGRQRNHPAVLRK